MFIAIDLDGREDIPENSSIKDVLDAIKRKEQYKDIPLNFYIVKTSRGLAQVLSKYETLETVMTARDVITASDAVSLIAKSQEVLDTEFVEVEGKKIKKALDYSTDFKVGVFNEEREQYEVMYTSDIASIIMK